MGRKTPEGEACWHDYLDRSDLFRGTVRKDSRSLMNVPFTGDKEKKGRGFVATEAAGLIGLKGHRSVGGYAGQSVPAPCPSGVEALVPSHAQNGRQR